MLIIEGFYTILAGSVVFVAGLAWNTAFQGFLQRHFSANGEQTRLDAKFAYALGITVVAVIIVVGMAKMIGTKPIFSS